MKLSLIVLLARYLEDHKEELGAPRIFLLPIVLTLVPAALVLRQPDLGTALVLLFTSISVMLVVGLKFRYFIYIGGTALAIAPFLWSFLRDYQKNRFLVFVNPGSDPMGAGYHLAQSKIAVGSGGLIGKGWMGATQSQLNFLPANHTDFIFAGLAEQWGFIGCLGVLVLYAYLFSIGLRLARDARDLFSMIMSFGIVSKVVAGAGSLSYACIEANLFQAPEEQVAVSPVKDSSRAVVLFAEVAKALPDLVDRILGVLALTDHFRPFLTTLPPLPLISHGQTGERCP